MKLKTIILFIFLSIQVFSQTPLEKYNAIQNQLKTGWNTWDYHSILTHVLLPEGLSINIGLKERNNSGRYQNEFYPTDNPSGWQVIKPGLRTYDGSYTECNIDWLGNKMKVQSAVKDGEQYILVQTIETKKPTPHLILEVAMLWNKKGTISFENDKILAQCNNKTIEVRSTSTVINDQIVHSFTPHLAVKMEGNLSFYTGKSKTLAEVQQIIEEAYQKRIKQSEKFLDEKVTYDAIQSAIAWNTIYDPMHDRVITPVSRWWVNNFQGFVLFCWDTYFSAYLASIDNKELAYANFIEITNYIKTYGMVPNYMAGYDAGSADRTMLPVGTIIAKEIYKKYQDKWFLELVFEDLLTWNRWYIKNRANGIYLSWGSNPIGTDGEAHKFQGASYESGLDNSPMYIGVPFNDKKNVLELADVGLMSMYVADCKALAEVAILLGKKAEAQELTDRAAQFSKSVQTLWDEKDGVFYNLRTDTKQVSKKLSPFHFFPLLAELATPKQAERIVNEHYFNEKEFYGEWMIPTIARNDSLFKTQSYWQGRIWPSTNFLVYLSLAKYKSATKANQDLASKSNFIMLKEYKRAGFVRENFHAIKGDASNCDFGQCFSGSDCYYHWGGLFGVMNLIDKGFMPNTSLKLPLK